MQLKIESHKEIELDMHRSYAIIYEWIKGIDAAQAFDKKIIDNEYMKLLTLSIDKKIERYGFRVRDRKPHHIIIRPKESRGLKRYTTGKILCGLIDFELLERTVKRQELVKKAKRKDYLKRQKDRFTADKAKTFHPHLHHVNVFGIDYIYGHVESTKGRLWVVGKDPYLFEYFLPERWEKTPKTRISVHRQLYHTITKDNIHLVWGVSKVGTQPDMDIFRDDEKKILDYGYNSPFEEISLALELNSKGIKTTYPRAIYMTGNRVENPGSARDNSRYESHKGSIMPDMLPILIKDHEYIIIWGYWNGPDEKLAAKDEDYYEGIDTLRALKKGIITREEYITYVQVTKEKLEKAGVEDLNLRGNHILISLDRKGNLIKDTSDMPEIRLCNFEFFKKRSTDKR